MLQRLKHQFRLGVPLMAFTAVFVFALSVGGFVSELASAQQAPSSHLVFTMGEGLDEFTLLMSASVGALIAGAAQYGVLIALISLIATAVTVLSSLAQVSRWVGGPSDVGAFARHLIDRGGRAVGVSETPVSWGVVHDAHSMQVLPLATVHLLDARGSVMASAVADTAGRYGFYTPAKDMIAIGAIAGLLVHKDGYFFTNSNLPRQVGLAATHLDIPMERLPATSEKLQTTTRAGALVKLAQSFAFWSATVALPVAYVSAPSNGGALLMTLFGLAAIVRAVGSGNHTLTGRR